MLSLQEDSCPELKLECKYCDLEFRRIELSEHIEGCGSRTDHCELCNRRVMLKDMAEHKENKCATVMVDDTIDITSHGQSQRPGLFFTQQTVLTPNGYPLYESVNLSPHHSSMSFPFPFGHLHQYPQQSPLSAYEALTPADKHHEEEKLHVDPQWLASVADVCGEEDLDQVLAQSVMVQGSYSAAATRSNGRQAHSHESVDIHDAHASELKFQDSLTRR